MNRYEKALEEVKAGNLRVSKQGDYELFCYTQDCFFGKNTWNDITTTHRGTLYYKGVPVNFPFKKIFNLNEQIETSEDEVMKRIRSGQEYNIYDKANGHLLIVSAFVDDKSEQQVVIHTKGALLSQGNDLLINGVNLFCAKYGEGLMRFLSQFPCATLMFEAIVDYDKHTMYERQVEMYGENTFVLLGAHVFEDEWLSMVYDDLKVISEKIIGTPVVKKYDSVEGVPSSWLDHKDIEGYVIHFLDDDFRVKIKTKEYWALRFKKDLTAENIIRTFRRSGFSKIRTKLPEEVSDEIVRVISEHFDYWYKRDYVNVYDLAERHTKWYTLAMNANRPLTEDERKDLFVNSSLTDAQKHYVYSTMTNDYSKTEYDSKRLRAEFEKWLHVNKKEMDILQNDIEEIVNIM